LILNMLLRKYWFRTGHCKILGSHLEMHLMRQSKTMMIQSYQKIELARKTIHLQEKTMALLGTKIVLVVLLERLTRQYWILRWRVQWMTGGTLIAKVAETMMLEL
jgi:hypothetical protein